MKAPCVYILASRRNGTLYTGVSADLPSRMDEHIGHLEPKSFTTKYVVTRLVWFEDHETMDTAIQREKRIKKWNRAWKLALIEKDNPDWLELDPVTGVSLEEIARRSGLPGQAGQ